MFNEDGDYDTSCVWYRATIPDVMKLDEDCEEVYLKNGSPASPWMASIHMPHWASRIQLEITGIHVERVQEGELFRELWDDHHAKDGYGWDVNPWAWVIEFKVVGNALSKNPERE